MKAKHAGLIREGIEQAKEFEYIEDGYHRMEFVDRWAKSMYCYGEVLASNSAFLIAHSMVTYTRRRLKIA